MKFHSMQEGADCCMCSPFCQGKKDKVNKHFGGNFISERFTDRPAGYVVIQNLGNLFISHRFICLIRSFYSTQPHIFP